MSSLLLHKWAQCNLTVFTILELSNPKGAVSKTNGDPTGGESATGGSLGTLALHVLNDLPDTLTGTRLPIHVKVVQIDPNVQTLFLRRAHKLSHELFLFCGQRGGCLRHGSKLL